MERVIGQVELIRVSPPSLSIPSSIPSCSCMVEDVNPFLISKHWLVWGNHILSNFHMTTDPLHLVHKTPSSPKSCSSPSSATTIFLLWGIHLINALVLVVHNGSISPSLVFDKVLFVPPFLVEFSWILTPWATFCGSSSFVLLVIWLLVWLFLLDSVFFLWEGVGLLSQLLLLAENIFCFFSILTFLATF